MTHLNNEPEEILDLVNENDQIIGHLERSQVYAAGLHNFRVVNALLINKQGQLWIPRRTAHKKSCPLHLDFSVSGHVSSGETYDQAFIRELEEELNLTSTHISWKKLGLITPHTHGAFAFNYCYQISYNQTPTYNRNDFSEYSWLYPEELLEKIAQGEKAKSDLPIVLSQFYSNKHR